jgi:hypothetical protein
MIEEESKRGRRNGDRMRKFRGSFQCISIDFTYKDAC